ncbi:hypothetical protein EDC30_110115 [Paucimonas lemoignei]|uniref:Uncharacterized protein n=1 Tax=Paucimonas lemoignei TaxID=29443 RepID=A0A4R3HRA9_PAULE|nr:hypothetical protein [Paucimonas lemoignei]TCS35646.1 hypothetical protein EDC30_110115 [Paucimonas lemoignei]
MGEHNCFFMVGLFPAQQPVGEEKVLKKVDEIKRLIQLLFLSPCLTNRFNYGYHTADGMLWLVVSLLADRQLQIFDAKGVPIPLGDPRRHQQTQHEDKTLARAWQEADHLLQKVAAIQRLTPRALMELMPRGREHQLGETLLSILYRQPSKRLSIRFSHGGRTLDLPELPRRVTFEDPRGVSARVNMVGLKQAVIFDVRDHEQGKHLVGLGGKKIQVDWTEYEAPQLIYRQLRDALEMHARIDLQVRQTWCNRRRKLLRLELVTAMASAVGQGKDGLAVKALPAPRLESTILQP